jgi:hypothetical protein
LLLRLPVRCRTCQERSYAGIFTALRIRMSGEAHHDSKHSNESTHV